MKVLEEVRQSYCFVVVGYVVMPEHVHLLISEPERGDPSLVMQVLKQRFARKLLRRLRQLTDPLQAWPEEQTEGECHVWQRRFYDFVVWNEHKRAEKLRYMHQNPVKRVLVLEAGQRGWSSFRYYAYDETGTVMINEPRRAELGRLWKQQAQSCDSDC